MKNREFSDRDKTARMIMGRLEGDHHRKIQVAYGILGDMESAGWKFENVNSN